MGVELPLRVVVTILECCVTFSGVKLSIRSFVLYLYEPGELEVQIYNGLRVKRSTDPIWSVDVYKIKDRYVQRHQPTLYYLDGGPK